MKKILLLFFLSSFIVKKIKGQVHTIQDNTTSVTILPTNISSSHISNNTFNKNNLSFGKDALLNYYSDIYDPSSFAGNVAIGIEAMKNSQFANNNVAIGIGSNFWSIFSDRNVSIGRDALKSHSPTSGIGDNNDDNVAIGFEAMKDFLCGNSWNVGIGTQALYNGSYGSVAIGYKSGYNGASYSVLVGIEAGNSSNSNTVALGYQSAYSSASQGGVFIGFKSGYNETTDNKLYIENSDSNTPLIGGDFSTNVVSINRPISSLSGRPNDKLQVGGNVQVYGNM